MITQSAARNPAIAFRLVAYDGFAEFDLEFRQLMFHFVGLDLNGSKQNGTTVYWGAA